MVRGSSSLSPAPYWFFSPMVPPHPDKKSRPSWVLCYSAFPLRQQGSEGPIGGFQITHHHTPTRMVTIRLTVPRVGKNMEKQILIHP